MRNIPKAIHINDILRDTKLSMLHMVPGKMSSESSTIMFESLHSRFISVFIFFKLFKDLWVLIIELSPKM